MEVLARLGVAVVENGLGQLPAGRDVDADESQTAVKEHRAASNAERHVVLHKNTAVERPDRLQLLAGHHPPVQRRAAESPDQRAVVGSQTIKPAVGRAEQYAAAMDRRRRIDSAACRVAPEFFAGGGV